MNEETHQPAPSVLSQDSLVSAAEFPTEPFPCPACGQLLASSCRVCVACKHAINPAEIVRPQAVPAEPTPSESAQPKLPPVRFSWPLFFVVLGVSCFLVLIFQGLWKDQQNVLLAMGGLQTLAAVWVFFDALREGVPKPLRWSIGSMLLPLVIFPWYLARRRTPQAPVPILEGGPAIRLVILALLLFFIANLIFYLVQGPPPSAKPAHPANEHKSGINSQARLHHLPLRLRSLRGELPGKAVPRRGSRWGSQAETNAPSDAWHT